MTSLASSFQGASLRDILAWRRPLASSIILLSFLVTWSTFVLFKYSVVTFMSRIAMLLFIAGGVGAITKRADISASELSSALDRVYESLRPAISVLVDALVSLFTWKDVSMSAKFFIATFVTAYIGNWIRDSILLLILVLMAFSLPIVYENNRDAVDAMMRQVQDAIDKALEMAKLKTAVHRDLPTTGNAQAVLSDLERKTQ